ncbi:MAG: VCBS domain-containing protein, partial [bacterium]
VEGIAITSLNSSNGTWEYSIDGGTNWSSVGSVSSTSALLLRSTDLVRFVPNGQVGTTADFTFRGWDQTSGTPGNKADTSTNGGSTSFSLAVETASITVTNVNDPPVLSGIESTTLSYTEGTEIAISPNLALSDVDSANIASATIQITGNFRGSEDRLEVYGLYGNQTATWDANTGTLTITGSQTLARYQTILRTVSYWNYSDSPDPATRTVTFTINDGSANSNSVARAISIANVNDAPTAVADTATALEAGGQSNGTAGTNPSGNVLTNDTDVDAGDTKTVSGIAAGSVGSASGNVGSSVTGTYGSIIIAADGSYTYTVDNSNSAVQALRTTANTLSDVFTYTI